MIIGAEQAEYIREWNRILPRPVSITFERSRDGRSKRFEAFLNAFVGLAPMMHVTFEQRDDDGPPAIVLNASLRYHALPEGGELRPFLDILTALQVPRQSMNGGMQAKVEEIQWPADLTVYITPHCPFCPEVLRQIAPLALSNPMIHVTVVDGDLFPEIAGKHSVRSVPTVILDSFFRWTGFLRIEEILDALMNRDPSHLSAKALEDLLKDGNASLLAQMMLDRKCIFPAYLDLLEHPEWSVRLGAMVVIEDLAENEPGLAARVLDPLWDRLDGMGEAAKGDVLYLFGLLGSEEWIGRIEGLLAGASNPELAEILREVLENLRCAD